MFSGGDRRPISPPVLLTPSYPNRPAAWTVVFKQVKGNRFSANRLMEDVLSDFLDESPIPSFTKFTALHFASLIYLLLALPHWNSRADSGLKTQVDPWKCEKACVCVDISRAYPNERSKTTTPRNVSR